MYKVTLTPKQCEIAIDVAIRRTEYNKRIKNGNPGKVDDSRSTEEITSHGTGAEIAASMIYGVKPRLYIDRPQEEVDIVTPGGYDLDVKSTIYPDGRLLIKYYKDEKVSKELRPVVCDYYCLFIGRLPDFTYVGYATRDMVLNAPVYRLDKVMNYVLMQRDLIPGLCP